MNTTFSNSIQTQILQYEAQLMQSVSEQVDQNISYSVHISYYLSGNKAFNRLMAKIVTTNDELEESVREVSGYMRDVIGSGSIGEFSFVLFPEQNLTVPSSGGFQSYHTFDDYYNSVLKFDNMTADQFYEQMERIDKVGFLPVLTQQISTVSQDYLCMVQQIPTAYLKRKAYFVSFYNVEKLSATIIKNLPADSYYIVCGPDQTKLTGNAPLDYEAAELQPISEPRSTRINGNAYLTFYEKSDTSGLQFYYFLPRSLVLQRILYYQELFLIVILGTLVLSVLASFLLAFRHYMPVKKLYQQVCPDDPATGSEFTQLAQQWSQTQRINESYIAEIYQQYQLLQGQFLTQLLTVQTEDEAALLAQVHKYNLPFSAPAFYVVILRGCPSERLKLPDVTYCPFAGIFSGTFIVNDVPDGSRITRIRHLLDQMKQEFPAMRAEISSAGQSLCALSQCFREVSGRLDAQSEKTTLSDTPAFLYPMEQELYLAQALSGGSCDACKQVLNDIFKANLEQKLPPNQLMLLIHQITATICRVYKDMQGTDQDILLQIQGVMAASEPSCLPQLELLCRKIADQANKEKGNKNRRITEAVVGYIQMHFDDPMLSLNSVADACHVSYYYVSHILKDEVHQSFTDLLNGYRIEQAKNMLTQSDKNVQDIAEQVGFSNTNTFFRVFRKYTGVTPQRYRQKEMNVQ